MPPNNAAARVEREKLVSTLLAFAKTLPERLKTVPFNPALIADIESNIYSIQGPGSAPAARRGEFDSIGTKIWNESTRHLREAENHPTNAPLNLSSKIPSRCICLLRIFGLYLIDAAHDAKPMNIQAFSNGVRLWKLSLKCAKSCAMNDELEWATKALEKSARYLDEVSAFTGLAGKEKAVVERLNNEFLTMRVLLGWKQGKLAELSEHWFLKIDLQSLKHDPLSAEELADVLYEIGKDENEKKNTESAIRWVTRALNIFDDEATLGDMGDAALDLKSSALTLLVNAQISLDTPDSLQKARNTIALMDAQFGDRVFVLFLKLELLAKEKTPDPAVYRSILLRLFRTLHLSKANFRTLVSHLHKLRLLDPIEACKALDDLLTIRLFEQEEEDFTERALVMRLWITTAFNDPHSAIKSLKEFLELVSRYVRGSFSTSATHAAQSLIWKLVEAQLGQSCFQNAEALCRLALSPVFNNTGEGNKAKLARKVMICSLAQNNLNGARQAFYAMSEASQANPHSKFLMYKVALRSEDAQLASDCLDAVAKGATKDATLLYACVLEAQKLGQKQQAILSLKQVLEKYKYNAAPGVQLPALLRVLAKLIWSDFNDKKQTWNLENLETFCRIFEAAAAHAGKTRVSSGNVPGAFNKDEIDWFGRTSYNFSLEFCSKLHPKILSRMMNSSIQFIDLLEQHSLPLEMTSLARRKILCQYLAMVSFVMLGRETDEIEAQRSYYLSVLQISTSLRENIINEIDFGEEEVGADQMLDLQTKQFEAVRFGLEASTRLKKWDELSSLFQECWRYNTNKQWKTLADLAFTINEEVEKTAASESNLNGFDSETYRDDILTFIKRLVQHATTHKAPPILIARWIRTLFQLALTSPTRQAEALAIELIEQALSLSARLRTAKTNGEHIRSDEGGRNRDRNGVGDQFPPTEIEWLATTTFNCAIDYYAAGAGGEVEDRDKSARTWAEKAIVLAGELVNVDGGALMRLLQEKYARLTWQENEENGGGGGGDMMLS